MSDLLDQYVRFADLAMQLDDADDAYADVVRDSILDPLWAQLRPHERAALNARGDMSKAWPVPALIDAAPVSLSLTNTIPADPKHPLSASVVTKASYANRIDGWSEAA